MSDDNDQSENLRQQVLEAAETTTPLVIRGGGSKAFYGREISGQALEVGGHRGIVSYEPTELVITARAGTPLAEIRQALAERDQMLGCEPPAFGETATVGGMVACGLSGPRRPYAGAVRDFVLGVRVINGQGQILRFGGEVMKNVAGYDLSRLMTGALGTLGVLLEASLKVLPVPAFETTLTQELPLDQAIKTVNGWSGKPVPLSAACHDGRRLHIRLSGAASAVRAARETLGGDVRDDGEDFWRSLREQSHDFFTGDTPLWRLSLPPATPPLDLDGDWLVDWGGAQRWLRSPAPAPAIRQAAATAGGHATLFRGGDRQGQVFQPLDPVLLKLHRNLKRSLDPKGIFNPGRMYPDL